jgi:CheY-like chemotaxis protein
VVLTDFDMPGMTGPQLCAAIRADAVLSDVPVAILSGSLRHGDPRAADVYACGVAQAVPERGPRERRAPPARRRPARSRCRPVAVPVGRRTCLTGRAMAHCPAGQVNGLTGRMITNLVPGPRCPAAVMQPWWRSMIARMTPARGRCQGCGAARRWSLGSSGEAAEAGPRAGMPMPGSAPRG